VNFHKDGNIQLQGMEVTILKDGKNFKELIARAQRFNS
jgi:hypothetical protein